MNIKYKMHKKVLWSLNPWHTLDHQWCNPSKPLGNKKPYKLTILLIKLERMCTYIIGNNGNKLLGCFSIVDSCEM